MLWRALDQGWTTNVPRGLISGTLVPAPANIPGSKNQIIIIVSLEWNYTEQKPWTQHAKCWSHVSWAEIKDCRNVSNFVHKCVYIHVSEHFSFAEIIHPADKCGISRSWLNSMINTQVHLVLRTIKGSSKTCSCVTQRLKLRDHAIGMLTAQSVRQSCCQRI